jgi:hypothetical protein
MERGFDFTKLLPLLIPILIIQIGLQIYALIDLSRQDSVRGSKIMWVAIIILGEIAGPIVYFIFAKRNE